MIRVKFVCYANICRLPMAEYLFRHEVEQAGLAGQVSVASSGTSDMFCGYPMHEGTWHILANRFIDGDDFVSSTLAPSDADAYDYIVVMDDANLADARVFYGDSVNGRQLFKLTDLIPEAGYDQVPDPMRTHDFAETERIISAGCRALLDKIRVGLAAQA